ncbi:MAG: NADPH-dependent F420 reductase [Hyphomicrobiaceae bacterium]|nr:NADPH-dependent F420 reductase [Hyphomicrobiaceae bacterium]
MSDTKPTIAVIGGTGDLGTGLARRWAKAGYALVIGSRTADKAESAATALADYATGAKPRGMANREAAAAGEVIVLTVPFATAPAVLDDIKPVIQGKLLVDTTVPLMPPRVARVQLPPEGCAAVAASQRLGEGVRVVSAFHNVAAHKLEQIDLALDCDVLVFGDKAEDREVAIKLAEALGVRGLHAGPLANSAAAEALTSVIIGINRTYKVDGASIRITGFGPKT